MLSRFLEIFDEIKKASIDAKIEFNVSKEELKTLEALKNCLHEASAAITKLSHRKANLNTCDQIISKLIVLLDKYDHEVCKAFKAAVIERYNSRRTKHSDYLAFLLQNNVPQDDNLFYNVGQIDFDDFEKLFNQFSSPIDAEEKTVRNDEDAVDASMNFDLSAPTKKPRKEMPFKELLKIFLSTGELPQELKAFTQILLTIRPTSTETERCFSLAKLVLAPRRNRMHISLLSDIVILNKFYSV